MKYIAIKLLKGRKEGKGKGVREKGEEERKKGKRAQNSERKSTEPPVQSLSSQRRPKVRELRLICFQTMFQNIKT